MLEDIRMCSKCGLCNNQRPLLDSERPCQDFWVGLSAKKVTSEEETPLSEQTNTGKLIQKIEEMCNEVSTYKTNLVKCLPLTEQQKLRYPSKKEMDKCFDNLVSEINAMSPKIVFLLGEKVYSSVARHLHLDFEKWNDFEYHYTECNGTYYVPIHHPSYICVYKRKQMDDYIAAVEKMINELL